MNPPGRRRRDAARAKLPVPLPQVWAEAPDAPLDAYAGGLRAGARYDGVELTADQEGACAPDVRLLECAARGARWDDLSIRGSELVDCLLESVAASALQASDGNWRDVLWRGCRIGALEAYGSRWQGVGVQGGRWDYVDLRGATLERIRLDGCSVGELDLTDADVASLSVTDCRIERLVLHQARLRDVDLRGARLAEISGLAALAGATISAEQLHDLARPLAELLGIRVATDDSVEEPRGNTPRNR